MRETGKSWWMPAVLMVKEVTDKKGKLTCPGLVDDDDGQGQP